ncbi:TPA: ABC transporter ATP-binding protein [Candidatus Woesearchaeota archaeon]|nr:ABC transporter ATP-binding protein [Candidatus Woesearchaeota archaeon]HIH31777.1 ABC transporter ATP-binding protein [Candidatus Woesearchaeota archaeon]HIH54662.1 ABC transporter ATP-binding protein [Candidatus Woesearchaeota archaeon]HIJ01549.1 ABC transporter ATP-binding protein [Candidatus Woesearchaeota archaeon]HIJ13952.1 ABC transporter ATP-binding protein [Candidatus Woesearchaeota archaeon]
MKDKPVIELRDVWKIYDMGEVRVEALRGINLNVHKGEFVAIQGPSGSGKSTAMNMVGCLDVPSKGHILLDGHDIARLSESQLAQVRGKKIGFIFQKFNLINTLSAQENVMLPLTFLDVPEEKRKQISYKLMETVNLGDRTDHKPNELSGGQQQRVAIARALAVDPEILLADEPTGNLDSKSGETVMHFLEDLHRKGKTIVMVTHDDNLAKFADRIEVLKDGQIVKSLKCYHKDGKNYCEEK